MKNKKWKLYIWREIRVDCTPGIGFAIATSKKEAIKAIQKISEKWEWDCYAKELSRTEPEIHNPPYGGWIGGGG